MGAATSCFGIDDESTDSPTSRCNRSGCSGFLFSYLNGRLLRRSRITVEPASHSMPQNGSDYNSDSDDLSIWHTPLVPISSDCPNSTAGSPCDDDGDDMYDDDDDDDEDEEEEEVCLICLHEYSPENPNVELMCSHKFHMTCVLEWKEMSNNCAVCGQEIRYHVQYTTAAGDTTVISNIQ